jgi:hypothetical protein
MTTTTKTLLLLLLMNLIFACSNHKDNHSGTDKSAESTANTEKSVETVTINGTVKATTFGKDGYTADVQTDTEGIYAALVSIVNLGGREHYQTCNVGDKVTFKGVPSVLGDAKQLMVKEIINITAAQATDLAVKYNAIGQNEYCWQTNKVLDLHTAPASDSKVEGKHFAGELLKVIGTKTIDNQLWVNVSYRLKVKAGYESQFADGQVMSSGSPTGWIGGAEIPSIDCK